MRQVIRAGLSVIGVAGVAALLLFGSQTLRHASLTTADELASPSPSPIAEACITPDNCPSPVPTCVPGEGTTCESSPAPLPTPSANPTPTDSDEAGTHPPAGSIEVSAVWFLAGRMGVTVAVIYGGRWVSGAAVAVHCTGPGFDVRDSGDTAPRSNWSAPSTSGPQPPSSPSAYFWTVFPEPVSYADEAEARQFSCHGTASYNGLSKTF
jgi:hypothetical protein